MNKLLCLVFALLTASAAQAAIILQYHHVATDTPRSTSVTPAEFRQQMQHLKDLGYHLLEPPSNVADLRLHAMCQKHELCIPVHHCHAMKGRDHLRSFH